MLYYLTSPRAIYIRNFRDFKDEPLLPHTKFDTTDYIRKIEVTLIHGQPTKISRLINFNRTGFSSPSSISSTKDSHFHYIAQIDYSLLRNPYDINRLVESLSCRHGLVYQLAFTNIVPGDSCRKAELFITSTGTARLKLPMHAFVDDNLVTYLSVGLPVPLTELTVDDTIPLDHTTLSRVRRNLIRLVENLGKDIREATLPTTLSYLRKLIRNIPRLYNLTLTEPKTTSYPQIVEYDLLLGLSSCSPSITILTLPAMAFTPSNRDIIATRLRRLQELKIIATAMSQFSNLPTHKPGDFKRLRCLTFTGSLRQFMSLLPSLFPNPVSSSTSTSKITSTTSNSSISPNKFINLTLHVPFLTNKHDIKRACMAINTYIPRVDIVKLHVKDWGPGEPKSGSWWTKSPVAPALDGSRRLPGRVMCDFTHPCQKGVGSKRKNRLSKVRNTSEDRSRFRKWFGGILPSWWHW